MLMKGYSASGGSFACYSHLEARDRSLQLDRELGKLANRYGGFLGTGSRLTGDSKNALHRVGHFGRDVSLRLGVARNRLNQVGQIFRYLQNLLT